ncbi:MAG TPA: metalloregulator ArsR/SmtB family transcription factor [Candidatus Saccharimonadales bacterium]|nr:metalloregulator ArsR/SmtB family transcription factor [Candidatus Saccharimonadales bacterium]
MDTFAALADPTRRNIFEYIVRGETSVGEIVKQFSFKAPTISQHLKVLKEVGLVRSRVDKQRRLYTAQADGLTEAENWLQLQKKFMSERLDALESHLSQQ